MVVLSIALVVNLAERSLGHAGPRLSEFRNHLFFRECPEILQCWEKNFYVKENIFYKNIF